MRALLGSVWLLVSAMPTASRAEDGYELWLRYRPLESAQRARVEAFAQTVVAPAEPSAMTLAALDELRRGLTAMLGHGVSLTPDVGEGAVVIGTPQSLPLVGQLGLPLERVGKEGYVLRRAVAAGHDVTVVAANQDVGLLYGVFALLRSLQTGQALDGLDIVEAPAVELRVLNHWDNLDGTVERGYAGASLWDWWRLPEYRDPRYVDYARANASIGINGAVLNNVNAQAEVLSPAYIEKAAALAQTFRPYGIRVFLAVKFSSPILLGGLKSADPLDPQVREWWRDKAAEIYRRIPDFGGFLVKANSEGQPGPQDYGRSHVDGANMLAAALQPHGGVVMWRAFVYATDNPADRVRQAYDEFRPLDGKFADNVLLQVKNGPLDFQPREPFHPLFGAMPRTPLVMEFQITQEYLGFSTHLAYLGALYEEVLRADTQARGPGSTVARVVDGTLEGHSRTGIAGVANIGTARDWTGAPFTQANWYAFGRLAWNPQDSARRIATEWLQQTFSRDARFVAPMTDVLMRSREAVVDYMTPLGLAHLMGTGHHYGPAPWVDDLKRAEWTPYYYHRADASGIGFDRTARGSNAVAQYSREVAAEFADLGKVPDQYLLWFHRLPWDHRMRSGKTLWEELVAHYDHGVAEVQSMRATWERQRSFVDAERFDKAATFFAVHEREAQWWRDACLAYFAQRSGRSLPVGARAPAHTLDYYKGLEYPYAPGH